MAPFSNTCAKYVHLGSTFAVFLEHVWRFSSHTTCILHTCSKNTSIAKVGKYLGKRWSKRFRSSTKTTYSSSTCANKSADRRVVFETITFHRRIRYIFAPWNGQPASLIHSCNGQSVTFRPHLAQRAASPFWSSVSQLLSRTRAQSTCNLVAHLPYFSNTCAI